ncbi:hypothetical protein [Nocardia blacklockiae]|uniref:hypothetical protein n=1 Tax=Nocardia blacklockiae TaxID=480036 RepID=UPI001895D241|nr:hypothetical protein [Nocardia blacklockiae]MBF6171058.1 hypothetical protein [Nocardia blacklockiae]
MESAVLAVLDLGGTLTRRKIAAGASSTTWATWRAAARLAARGLVVASPHDRERYAITVCGHAELCRRRS